MTTRFSFVVHGHQPPGNFDSVFRRAVAQCYGPFFDVLEEFPDVRVSVHFSGSLLEWLEQHDPSVIEAMRRLVGRGQVEPVAAGLYEPVLALLPQRDRVAQLRAHRALLRRLFGVDPHVGWLTERIWMQELAATLHDGGIEVVSLDDLHFLSAGVPHEELTGPFRTEYQGKPLTVVPALEEFRMSIPWRPVDEVIGRLRVHAAAGVPLIVFADDIEKLGLWPGTFESVHRRGWLRQFFEALSNLGEVETAPLGEATAALPPGPRVYLPDGSYPEMLRWSLPPAAQRRAVASQQRLERANLWDEVRPQLRSGTYFQFLAKYPESNHLHKRMLDVSARVGRKYSARAAEGLPPAVRQLYRAQANCAYWHGLFGGTYLPFLRQSLFGSLLRAERALEEAGEAPAPLRVFDLDADGIDEALIAGSTLTACIAPGDGGAVVELSDRQRAINIVDTLARRPEAYHGEGDAAPYPYDRGRRGCFVDRFLASKAPPPRSLPVVDAGSFSGFPYEMRARVSARPNPLPLEGEGGGGGKNAASAKSIEAVLTRQAEAPGGVVRIEKTITYTGGDSSTLTAAYRLTGIEGTIDGRFGIEHNLAVFFDERPEGTVALGGKEFALRRGAAARRASEVTVRLTGPSEGVVIHMDVGSPADIDVRPIATVSQSEGDYEEIAQSLACLFTWPLHLVAGDTIEVTASLTLGRSA